MSILDKINNIQEELELFENDMDKYEYIIDIGKSLKKLDEKYKQDSYLVQGCQSKVWLHIYEKDALIYIEADSDAFIVRGLVSILIQIYSQTGAKEILNIDISELEILGLNEILSQGRQNGISSMLSKIYKFAKEVEDDE